MSERARGSGRVVRRLSSPAGSGRAGQSCTRGCRARTAFLEPAHRSGALHAGTTRRNDTPERHAGTTRRNDTPGRSRTSTVGLRVPACTSHSSAARCCHQRDPDRLSVLVGPDGSESLRTSPNWGESWGKDNPEPDVVVRVAGIVVVPDRGTAVVRVVVPAAAADDPVGAA